MATLAPDFKNIADVFLKQIQDFNPVVEARSVGTELEVNQLSAFLKETVQITLPKNFSLQFNGEYRTRASFTPTNNTRQFGGPPSSNTAQGYTREMWFVDASVRKGFLNNKASLTLSIQDIFGTRKFGSYTLTDYFSQDSYRLMQPRMLRLNFAYRFGDMDTSLFNRKNTNVNTQGNDMM